MIKTRPLTKEYEDGWDRIFNRPADVECPQPDDVDTQSYFAERLVKDE